MRRWDFGPFLERLQEAALDPFQWPTILDKVADIVDGAGAVLFGADPRLTTNPHLTEPPSSRSLTEVSHAYIQNGWSKYDERFKGVPILMRKGLITDEDFISKTAIDRSAFYQDFLRESRLGGFAAVGFTTGPDLWALSIKRHLGQRPFDKDELQQLLTLRRPLHDAAALSKNLGFARVLGVTDAFELTNRPSLILDDRGGVIAMNTLAEDLLGRLFDVSQRRLVFKDFRGQQLFDVVVKKQIIRGTGPLFVKVKNEFGAEVAVRIIEMRGWVRYSFCNARLLLLIENTPRERHEATAALKSSYNLTAMEIQVAIDLGNGHSLKAIAEKLNVTYGTIRAHLRNIYSKTDTHRQAELVSLLAQVIG